MHNRNYCVANWKMNMTADMAVSFVEELKKLPTHNYAELIICADFVSLGRISELLKHNKIQYGAQNVYFEQKGAFTGEISTDMLKDIGAKYVIIGHSERRHIFYETDEMLNKKMHVSLSSGLIPIFCIGEKLEDREQNLTKDILQKQIVDGLDQISKPDFKKIIIAYEPVWAIGTGLNANNEQIESTHSIIRTTLNSLGFDGDECSILYGGSVNRDNSAELLTAKGVDGFLIGGASLKVLDFFTIYQKFNKELN